MPPEIMTYACPFCGVQARVGKPCPGCIRKESKRPQKKRSWQQDSSEDGLNLPDEDFDYDKFCQQEFGKTPHRVLGLQWYWWLLAVVVLAGMIAAIFT
jgi:hypothetical protein